MNIQQLTEDSKVILLLCGRFGKKSGNGLPDPLTTREYNILVRWLKENEMRPGDLVTPVGRERLQKAADLQLDLARVKTLLERGATLALAMEKWLNKGLWILSRSDANYPKILLDRLKQSAPPILFGAGNHELLSKGGLAIVGSRNFDTEAKEFTSAVARAAARDDMQIVSGGARGVDQEAMISALQERGTVVGVLSDGLQKAAVAGKYRQALRDKRLVLVSPYQPEARFTIGNAMGRNKYIYAFAEFGLVVSSSYNTGGTWAGAIEELRRDGGIPIFVRVNGNIPKGNSQLLKKGAIPFPEKPWISPMRTLLLSVAQAPNQSEQLQLGDKSWGYAKVSD
ncbi:MAG: DNA-processing protein DprA [PVC group bacterium]